MVLFQDKFEKFESISDEIMGKKSILFYLALLRKRKKLHPFLI